MKTKTAEDMCLELASAACDMMTLHSPHTESMMCDAIARWQKWQQSRKARKRHEADVQKRLVENECQIRNLARALQSAISRMETIRETHGHTIALDRDIENLKMWLPQPDAPTCDGEKRPAQCRILGCGRFAPAEEMRTYRIGSTPFDACPECWNAMELPEDCRDTADLGHNAGAMARGLAAQNSDNTTEIDG